MLGRAPPPPVLATVIATPFSTSISLLSSVHDPVYVKESRTLTRNQQQGKPSRQDLEKKSTAAHVPSGLYRNCHLLGHFNVWSQATPGIFPSMYPRGDTLKATLDYDSRPTEQVMIPTSNGSPRTVKSGGSSADD